MSHKIIKQIDSLAKMRLQKSWGKRSHGATTSRVSPLHEMIGHDVETTPEWGDVLSYVQRYPKEVMQTDRRGRTCLASACVRNPPLQVVKTMMRACCYGSEAFRDKSGKTALHNALNTNTMNMEVIYELCKSPELVQTSDHQANTPLHWACKENMEELVNVLLQAHPEAACQTNSSGRTPLHTALESKASFSIIEMIVQASPESVFVYCWGRTPLLTAIENSADYETHKLLVDTCPDMVEARDGRGQTMLQSALQHYCSNPDILGLLITSKEKVVEHDSFGRTALHVALSRPETNLLIVQIMLGAAPEASQVPSKWGERPLTMAYEYYTQRVHDLKSRSNSISACRDVMNWWRVVGLLLDAAGTGKSKLPTALETRAPIEVIKSLLKEYPEQIKAPTGHGDYPIAVAMKMQHMAKDELINLLLDCDSTTTSKPDSEGRSVLSLAAECDDLTANTMNRLIRAHPDALRSIDPTTKLYPVLIAACDMHSTNVDVSVIYELLSAAPDLLRVAIVSR